MGLADKLRNRFRMGKDGPRQGPAVRPAALTAKSRDKESGSVLLPAGSASR
jgi:hypothetical protein